MPRLPPLPDLEFTNALPFARGHGDVYFSGEGLSEKRTVFLAGCGLPEAWAGREHFVVGELGFGTGLNLLALWDLWRAHRPGATARLDVISFEGLPMSRAAAERIHAAWPELAGLSARLRDAWPERARGVQRIVLGDGVTLTLCIDDIASSLPQARAACDAWFLDGFAPAKNPEMWSAEVLGHVARLSAPGARAATYTVAGDVRRNLQAVGFDVAKIPGHGRKKERLEARLIAPRTQPPASAPRRVAVIGAGIAGACAARAFVRRGLRVTVYEQGEAPGAGASGNPIALVMPRLDVGDTPAARALLEAWLLARRFYPALGAEAAQAVDVIHLPRGTREEQRFAKLLADPPLEEALLQAHGAGLKHLGAVAVKPAEALPRLLAGAELRFGRRITGLADLDEDLIVVCAGMGMIDLDVGAPAIEGRLGQVDWIAAPGAPQAIADGGYAVQAFGELVFGATFETAHGAPRVTDAATAHNRDVLRRLRPDIDAPVMQARAAIRATTSDRLPFAGRPAEKEKAPDGTPAPSGRHRLIGGLGSRGFLWAPLLAELVASEALGEPLPVEGSVADCLDPGRFVTRALRRGN